MFQLATVQNTAGGGIETRAPVTGRMHTPGHPGHGPGFGPNFFHFAVVSTSGFGSITEKGLGSIAEEE